MNEKELRELDAWIAENVMGYRRTQNPDEYTTDGQTLVWERTGEHKESVLVGRAYTHSGLTREYGKEMFSHSWTHYRPTTDPAAAMMVWSKCLVKLRELGFAAEWMMWKDGTITIYASDDLQASAKTEPLAICLFAKKLFS